MTRPGVSMIASALAVELMVSILQHPLHGCAPAVTETSEDGDDDDGESTEGQSCLGSVPHQVRPFGLWLCCCCHRYLLIVTIFDVVVDDFFCPV